MDGKGKRQRRKRVALVQTGLRPQLVFAKEDGAAEPIGLLHERENLWTISENLIEENGAIYAVESVFDIDFNEDLW